ncbi:MAG: hypothetical protein KME63_03160 [Candidatus Thiodiazotropha sp. (ex Clathrolucina costata)]|nr:hypothetical protein [Candidatus Thiodiazotropha taylori]MCG7863019.1 hypothetical protein [Candidatus Thiodiazotropha endolucinida]
MDDTRLQYRPDWRKGCDLSRLKRQIPGDCKQGYSNSRTCEIGLSRHTGIPYRSIAYLIDYCYASKLDLSASVISRHNQIDG